MYTQCVMILLIFASTLIILEIGGVFIDNSDLLIETGVESSESQNLENILCRGCGSDVSSANFIISKLSQSSHYAFNDTLFKREAVLVQVVSHDIIFDYPVVTTTLSTCQGFGEWQVDNSWFPGYQWKLCICPDCGTFLGWVFKSINPGSIQLPDEFFCLVLTSLIGESCNYIFESSWVFMVTFFGIWVVVVEESVVLFICIVDILFSL